MGPFARTGSPFAFALRDGTPSASAPQFRPSEAAVPTPRPSPHREAVSTRGIDRTPVRVASLGGSIPTGRVPVRPSHAPADIHAMVTAAAQKHGVPLALAHAVVRVESNYKPHLIGRGATYGLMQIKYPTARGLGFDGKPNDLFDPRTNLEWGMRYLAGARKIAKGNLCGTILRYQGGHYSQSMTQAAAVYCGKVKRYMAESDVGRFAENVSR